MAFICGEIVAQWYLFAVQHVLNVSIFGIEGKKTVLIIVARAVICEYSPKYHFSPLWHHCCTTIVVNIALLTLLVFQR